MALAWYGVTRTARNFANDLAKRIDAGELRPGDAVPASYVPRNAASTSAKATALAAVAATGLISDSKQHPTVLAAYGEPDIHALAAAADITELAALAQQYSVTVTHLVSHATPADQTNLAKSAADAERA
ncbi:hypothetical protein ACIGO9_31335 [Nocardia asteroides]|uniref:hypothetical protein n=1 Tax=Nocardia asteroides TaxID=1824 RepID=UPI0037C541DC